MATIAEKFDPTFIRKIKELTGASDEEIKYYFSDLEFRSSGREYKNLRFTPSYLERELLYLAIRSYLLKEEDKPIPNLGRDPIFGMH